jgi:hypothetical protein
MAANNEYWIYKGKSQNGEIEIKPEQWIHFQNNEELKDDGRKNVTIAIDANIPKESGYTRGVRVKFICHGEQIIKSLYWGFESAGWESHTNKEYKKEHIFAEPEKDCVKAGDLFVFKIVYDNLLWHNEKRPGDNEYSIEVMHMSATKGDLDHASVDTKEVVVVQPAPTYYSYWWIWLIIFFVVPLIVFFVFRALSPSRTVWYF